MDSIWITFGLTFCLLVMKSIHRSFGQRIKVFPRKHSRSPFEVYHLENALNLFRGLASRKFYVLNSQFSSQNYPLLVQNLVFFRFMEFYLVLIVIKYSFGLEKKLLFRSFQLRSLKMADFLRAVFSLQGRIWLVLLRWRSMERSKVRWRGPGC